MLATWITPQLVFNGAVSGLAIGLLAMGMVLVYRSTRVVNFAVGSIGLVGAALLPVLVITFGFPYGVALAAALVCGTGFATIVELIVIRRLFHSPRVIVLVATVGIAQLAAGTAAAYPEIRPGGQPYPKAVTATWDDVLGLRVTGSQLAVVVVVPLLTLALMWLLHRTTFGKAVEASADNRPLARLAGVNPKLVSTFVWTVAGLLSTVSMVLLSTETGSAGSIADLGPLTLARAMLAFVLAGMRSFPRAVLFGLLIGVGEAVLRFNTLRQPGLADFLGFLLAVLAVYLQSRTRADDDVFAFTPKVRRPDSRVYRLWWVRNLPRIVGGVALLAAVVLPILVTRPSRQLLYGSIICFAICALSVTVITGWAGQLSLSQMSFAGLGALLAAALNRGLELDVWFVDVEAAPLPFFASMLVAAIAVAALAAAIGVGALRVRGLRLAVVTFMFAVAAEQYLYPRPLLSDGNPTSVSFHRGTLFGLDLTDQRTYYYVCLAAFVVLFGAAARLRRSGIGRTTIAVRDNPDAAAGYTVSPVRTKLTAFALAGGLAALGGALLSGLLQNIPFSERYFRVEDSLKLVGMVVIGGIGSMIGPLLGSMWVIGLPAFFPDNDLVPLFTSSVGLLLIVMYFPGGFAQVGYGVRSWVLDWAARRLPPEPAGQPRPAAAAVLAPPAARAPTPPAGDRVVLRATDLSVRFGGIHAVRDVSVEVRRGEIVGLIGTNGAGKSTLVNAVGGYVRSSGSVVLDGDEVAGLSVAGRARRGLGRTFQAATLFPELSVRETIEVALEARGRTSFTATTLGLPRARRQQLARRAAADDLIGLLGLGRYADMAIADLSTGTRRIVELADLLALDARVLCLDEPTAGLAQRETEAFAPLLVAIRAELDAAMIVIEHDMALIMAMSDRLYCMEAGAVIAEGPPTAVRHDPRVIASYLGTDERTIARSNTTRVP